MNDWQPIETAPLEDHHKRNCVGPLEICYSVAANPMCEKPYGMLIWHGGEGGLSTHWMPLPEPPN